MTVLARMIFVNLSFNELLSISLVIFSLCWFLTKFRALTSIALRYVIFAFLTFESSLLPLLQLVKEILSVSVPPLAFFMFLGHSE